MIGQKVEFLIYHPYSGTPKVVTTIPFSLCGPDSWITNADDLRREYTTGPLKARLDSINRDQEQRCIRLKALTDAKLDAVFKAWRGTSPVGVPGPNRRYACKGKYNKRKFTYDESRPPANIIPLKAFHSVQNCCPMRGGWMEEKIYEAKHALEPKTVYIGYKTALGRGGPTA